MATGFDSKTMDRQVTMDDVLVKWHAGPQQLGIYKKGNQTMCLTRAQWRRLFTFGKTFWKD